jgi:hypothetical protein
MVMRYLNETDDAATKIVEVIGWRNCFAPVVVEQQDNVEMK